MQRQSQLFAFDASAKQDAEAWLAELKSNTEKEPLGKLFSMFKRETTVSTPLDLPPFLNDSDRQRGFTKEVKLCIVMPLFELSSHLQDPLQIPEKNHSFKTSRCKVQPSQAKTRIAGVM
jgi:hypothetical protein